MDRANWKLCGMQGVMCCHGAEPGHLIWSGESTERSVRSGCE